MNNLKLITKSSSFYPNTFFKIKDSPNLLFALGNTKLLNTFSVGIVGARACSRESAHLTQLLVNQLCSYGITILSGMAYGIDQIAHESCIENHGKTIAIIGSGFEFVKNRNIFNKILENDGLILSEYFPDTPAFKSNFKRRNQLIVSLSSAIIAVETHIPSGTMITANEALRAHVPLFTFPGSMYDNKYLGNNQLLTKGALCINRDLNIIKTLRKIYPTHHFNKAKEIQNRIPENFKAICELLKKAPSSANEIAIQLNKPLSKIQSVLTLMELEDFIYKTSNNYYIKN